MSDEPHAAANRRSRASDWPLYSRSERGAAQPGDIAWFGSRRPQVQILSLRLVSEQSLSMSTSKAFSLWDRGLRQILSGSFTTQGWSHRRHEYRRLWAGFGPQRRSSLTEQQDPAPLDRFYILPDVRPRSGAIAGQRHPCLGAASPLQVVASFRRCD